MHNITLHKKDIPWLIGSTIPALIISMLLLWPRDIATTFNGKWVAGPESYNLYLDLTQDKDLIVGDYCAYTENAARLDCGIIDDNEKPIHGIVQGNQAQITFVDYRGGQTETATISLQKGKLNWQLTTKPRVLETDYILPTNAILTPAKNK